MAQPSTRTGARVNPPPTPGAIAVFEEGGQYILREGETSVPLYTFDKDGHGRSACNGACAAAWPPVVASAEAKPVGEWTTIKRDDGTLQWAWRGKPVYSYAKDTPENPTGDGVGGVWRLLPSMPSRR